MAILFSAGRFKATDKANEPIAGAFLSFYATLTSTFQPIYSDSALTTILINPVQADANGLFPEIWLDDSLPPYKVVFASPDVNDPTQPGSIIWTIQQYNATLSGKQLFPLIHPLTDAEIAAGVMPVDYLYPEAVGLAGAQRFGADPTGVKDATTALQNWANGCGGVMIFPPNASFLVSAQISIPAGTILYGNGSTLNAALSWSTSSGWHMLNGKGTFCVFNLNFTAPAVSRNTSWKAVTVDNATQALSAGTTVIVRSCKITNLDIGVYADGGASARISYAEVSGCTITINTGGTGGALSIRPTVNLNQCGMAVICDNPLLDASDRVNSVNNIYCIGCGKLTVEKNYVLSGTIKCLSNPTFSVDTFTLANNRLQAIPWVQCQVDTNPIKYVEILGNHFDTPVTQAADVACVIFSNLSNCASDSYESVHVAGNYFANVPYSCYYISPSVTNKFGAIILEGNHYNDTSSGSAGNYAIVNFTTNGNAYRSLIASDESVYGNTHTRSYLQAAAYSGASNPFTGVKLTNIEETGITGNPTGFVTKTVTLTLGGCTTAPTVTATYTIRDGIACINVPSVNATSNSTGCNLIGLPAELEPLTATSQISITASDNTTFTNNATAQITPGSSTIALAKNGSTTGWTNAGTKGPNNFTFTYPLG